MGKKYQVALRGSSAKPIGNSLALTVGQTREPVHIDAGYLPDSNPDKAALLNRQAVSKTLPDHDPKAAQFYMKALYDGPRRDGLPFSLQGMALEEKYILLAHLGALSYALGDIVFHNHVIQAFVFAFQGSLDRKTKKRTLPDLAVMDIINKKCPPDSPFRRVARHMWFYCGNSESLHEIGAANIEFLKELAIAGMDAINRKPSELSREKRNLLQDTPWSYFLKPKA